MISFGQAVALHLRVAHLERQVTQLQATNTEYVTKNRDLRTALERIVEWADAGCDPSKTSIEQARTILR